MRLLILGGTWFLGRTLAEEAVARGWDVTSFNRGRSGRDVPGTTAIRGDRTVADDVARLAAAGEAGRWDAVVDTSVYEPPDVLLTAEALRPVADRYVLLSTVSAYRDWPSEPVDESSPVWPSRPDARESDPDVAELSVPIAYGTLKAGCEQALESVFGADALILRPGVVLGPYEYVGRLQTLLRRAERGGPMLAAGDPHQPIQPVDVRDLSTFLLDQLAQPKADVPGSSDGARVFNVTALPGHATYGELLQACVEATGERAELVWADSDWLDEQSVQQWTQMPLWRTAPGTWAVDSAAAAAAGLACRPTRETVLDTWNWLQGEEPVAHSRQSEHGLPAEREAELLAAWSSRSG